MRRLAFFALEEQYIGSSSAKKFCLFSCLNTISEFFLMLRLKQFCKGQKFKFQEMIIFMQCILSPILLLR